MGFALKANAACGGDIIFIEACLGRSMRVHVHMPLADAGFISEYVAHGGDQWTERFYAIRNNPKVNLYFQKQAALQD